MQNNDQFQQVQSQVQQLSSQVATLQALFQSHRHDGGLFSRTNLPELFGMFEVVSVVPTNVPTGVYDQVKIYTNSTTYRLYWYDNVGHTWHYATGT